MSSCARICVAVAVALPGALGFAAVPAAAAVRAGSLVFDPNPSEPSFGNPTRLPLITITVSYDDQAGAITVSETGGDPSYRTGWAWFDSIVLTGTKTSTATIHGYWNYPYVTLLLYDDMMNGSLSPRVTISPDSSTISATWADPALAGQRFTFVNVYQSDQPDNLCSCDTEPQGSFYFSGYEPSIVVASPGPQSTQLGTPLGTDRCSSGPGSELGTCCAYSTGPPVGPCPGVQIAATEMGLASSDGAGVSSQPASAYSAAGLPPGLHIWGGGLIVGTPTRAGTYTPTVSGSAQFNNGTQTAIGTTSFQWVITPPPPSPVRLTVQDASRAFLGFLPDGAFIPVAEGRACPEIYETGGSYSICFAEYRLGARWHLMGGAVRIKANVPTARITSDEGSRRRWVKCNLRPWNRTAPSSARIPGTLVSNNDCGREAPQSDIYFVGQELDPIWLVHHPHTRVRSVGWQFAQSGGFQAIGRYSCNKRRGTCRCANAVGDAFRYRP